VLKIGHTGPSFKFAVTPADTPYSHRGQGTYNSWDDFGKKDTYIPPKALIVPNVPHWTNSLVFAVEYARRIKARLKVWTKPTYTEELRDERFRYLEAAE
jgi:hypothetical protein